MFGLSGCWIIFLSLLHLPLLLIHLEGDFFFYTSDLGTEVIQVDEAFLLYSHITSRWPLAREKCFRSVKAQPTDAAALTFIRQNYRVFKFSPWCWHPFWKRAVPTSPKATVCGHLQLQLARVITPSAPPHPSFLAKAVDLPKQLQKNLRTQAWSSFYTNSSCWPVVKTLPAIFSEHHPSSL